MNYYENFNIFIEWLKESIDEIRNYILPAAYPLYVLLYIDLVKMEKKI